jgi:4-hydroxybenzoyl-CoA thioesterase/acyl-CoA thioester hydrolase
MATSFRATRRVEFHDTDAAGIMHFSAFFIYMEQVEHEWLRHLGLSVLMRDEHGAISWPRVSAKCEFHGAVRFEDVLEIDARIERLGEKSVTYAFDFTSRGSHVASGSLTSVCCRLGAEGELESIVIPRAIVDKLSMFFRQQSDG